MPEVSNKTRDVFGVGRDVPLNYIVRPQVDEKFINNLTRDKHIVIYGSSKQGKTTLRKHCLDDTDYIVVSCLNTMALPDLNAAILKGAGYRLEQMQTKTVRGAWKYGAEFAGEGKVPFVAKASGKGNLERENGEEKSNTTRKLELDLQDVNDVVTALNEVKFAKYIILEDFHYLTADVQRSFAFSLKAYHENSSYCFIVVGVWREKNRLIYYNGDLTNRVVSIDADQWSQAELRQVVALGEILLNVQFDVQTIDGLIKHSSDAVAIVQEACFRICEKEGISQTLDDMRLIGTGVDTEDLIREIVNDQAGRYSAFITNFAEGFQQTDLEMYKWLIYAVLVSEPNQLEEGLRRTKISTLIKDKHPEGQRLNEGNITQALQNAASLQVLKGIRPIIFDYDQTTRVLTIVDRSFLIWLAHQSRDDLLNELGISP